jgi:hypothetical protein
LQTLTPASPSGTQQPETQSVPVAQIAAHEPPLVSMHLSFAQHSSLFVHALPAAAQVAAQKPRGWQYVQAEPMAGAQHPDSQPAPLAHGVAQYDWALMVGSAQTPVQQAFGVDVQTVPVVRQAGAPCGPASCSTASIHGASGAMLASRSVAVSVVGESLDEALASALRRAADASAHPAASAAWPTAAPPELPEHPTSATSRACKHFI